MALTIGLKQEFTKKVKSSDSAMKVGSGLVNVLATPAVVTFVEKSASKMIAPHLKRGDVTVGAAIDINHIGACKIGKTIKCLCKIKQIGNTKIVIHFAVTEGSTLIAIGTHTRVIVNKIKFMKKIKKRG